MFVIFLSALKTEEIRQIAGRAGRFGLYDTGYINAVGKEALSYIREHAAMQEDEVEHVSALRRQGVSAVS